MRAETLAGPRLRQSILSKPDHFKIALILLLAIALRTYALNADAPLDISLYYGLTNDGAASVAAARDRVLFGAWQPGWNLGFLYRSLPGISWLGYPFLKLLGTGYWQANFISVVAGLLTIAFVAGFARRHFGRRAALVCVLFLGTNYLFVVYHRTPIVYTTVACAQTAALYVWSLGLTRSPLWFLASLVLAVASAFLLKITAISILPALVLGTLAASFTTASNRVQRKRTVRNAVLMTSAALVLGTGVFILFVPDIPYMLDFIQRMGLGRTINSAYSLEENVRFLVQGPLQFGVYSSFFVRMLPLFLLSFGYLAYRGLRWLSRDRAAIPVSELVCLLYLLGTAGMLAFARSQATRYMILLIPPMALVAAIGAERWLQADKINLPQRFHRLYPAVVQLVITYLVYQVLASLLKLWRAARLDTGFGDFRTILDGPALYTLLVVALLLAGVATLGFLWLVVEKKRSQLALPPASRRAAVLVVLVLFSVGGNLFQYLQWADAPQYTLVNASREMGRMLDDDAIIGGDYAYPLALENNLRAFYFVPTAQAPAEVQQKLRSFDYTHLAIGQDGSLLNNTDMIERMETNFPDLMPNLRLIKQYELRDNLVNVYEVVK